MIIKKLYKNNKITIVCDVRFEDSVKKCIDKAVETFGGIDILVNIDNLFC